MYIFICEYNVADHADHTDPTRRNIYVQIMQIIQIPPGETCM